MAVQMPSVGLLLMHRLLRISTSSQRHVSNRVILVKLHKGRSQIRTFSAGSVKCNENERDSSDSSPLGAKLTSRQALLSRKRRPLSPLERISGLLPQDALSPEVMQLREQNQQDAAEDTNIQASTTRCTQEESGEGATLEKGDSENPHATDAAVEPTTSENSACHEEERLMRPTLPGESLLAFGELLVAEYYKAARVEFRKMFQLQSGARLQSSWGIILHNDIAGQPAGRFLKTSRGTPILIRRASLEDYVLFMKRGPAIAYPKVQCLSVCHSPVLIICSSSTCCVLSFSVLPGCSYYADDDGCHRGRLRAGVRLGVRGHVSVPVQSRSAPIILSLSHFGVLPVRLKRKHSYLFSSLGPVHRALTLMSQLLLVIKTSSLV